MQTILKHSIAAQTDFHDRNTIVALCQISMKPFFSSELDEKERNRKVFYMFIIFQSWLQYNVYYNSQLYFCVGNRTKKGIFALFSYR